MNEIRIDLIMGGIQETNAIIKESTIGLGAGNSKLQPGGRNGGTLERAPAAIPPQSSEGNDRFLAASIFRPLPTP